MLISLQLSQQKVKDVLCSQLTVHITTFKVGVYPFITGSWYTDSVRLPARKVAICKQSDSVAKQWCISDVQGTYMHSCFTVCNNYLFCTVLQIEAPPDPNILRPHRPWEGEMVSIV